MENQSEPSNPNVSKHGNIPFGDWLVGWLVGLIVGWLLGGSLFFIYICGFWS